MNEIRTWLDRIGLAQYTDAFEANDIDIDLLGQVDDQVLKDIGVSSAGHRLRIRNAIAKLAPALGGSSWNGGAYWFHLRRCSTSLPPNPTFSTGVKK